jgi:GR25 family glycosyltransferase involved in LPS biosynthesis
MNMSMDMDIKYYWINIDTSTERREFMENQFNKFHIKNERISAITPKTLRSVIQDEPPYLCGYPDCIKNNGKNCTYEYSTLSSHMKAIKEGYKSNADFFVVCEDDIYFNFKIDFEKLIKTLPPNFDIFQMMVISNGHTEIFYNEFYKKNVPYINYIPITPSAAFYLIRNKGAKKILDLYTNKNTGKFDFQKCSFMKLADVLIFQSVNTYVSTLPLCVPNIKFKSQIHEEHFDFHKQAQEKIIEVIKQTDISNIPFLTYNYPIEDLEKLSRS